MVCTDSQLLQNPGNWIGTKKKGSGLMKGLGKEKLQIIHVSTVDIKISQLLI